MRVVRLKPYLRAMQRMGLSEDQMRRIELDLVSAPRAHPVMQGLRGVRKARFALPRRGGRIIYFVLVNEAIYLMTAYPKNERDDLSADQRKAILVLLDEMMRTER